MIDVAVMVEVMICCLLTDPLQGQFSINRIVDYNTITSDMGRFFASIDGEHGLEAVVP